MFAVGWGGSLSFYNLTGTTIIASFLTFCWSHLPGSSLAWKPEHRQNIFAQALRVLVLNFFSKSICQHLNSFSFPCFEADPDNMFVSSQLSFSPEINSFPLLLLDCVTCLSQLQNGVFSFVEKKCAVGYSFAHSITFAQHCTASFSFALWWG